MNFQDIKYFYEVAKTQNISYAALNLNVTQPTITKPPSNSYTIEERICVLIEDCP